MRHGLPDRFGSLKVTAQVDLVPFFSGETARKIAAPQVAEKTDLILCTESPKSELTTESADGSMAKGTAVGFDHDGAAKSALTKCAFSWKSASRILHSPVLSTSQG